MMKQQELEKELRNWKFIYDQDVSYLRNWNYVLLGVSIVQSVWLLILYLR